MTSDKKYISIIAEIGSTHDGSIGNALKAIDAASESGAIEQDADIVSFIYRPEYYNIDTWDDNERSSTEGEAEFIVSKHRNGGLGNIRLRFISTLAKFEDIEQYDSPYEFHSKMNAAANDDTFKSDTGNMDDSNDDNDLPF